MVWLISQEIESLSQENFRQERKRPLFLRAEINCCEKAMLAYNDTYEEILDLERKRLIIPAPFSNNPHTPWGRLGIPPKDLVLESQVILQPQSARGFQERKKFRHKGSLTARSGPAAHQREHEAKYEELQHDHQTGEGASVQRRRPRIDGAGAESSSGLLPCVPLLPPAPMDWMLTPRSLPSSRIALKVIQAITACPVVKFVASLNCLPKLSVSIYLSVPVVPVCGAPSICSASCFTISHQHRVRSKCTCLSHCLLVSPYTCAPQMMSSVEKPGGPMLDTKDKDKTIVCKGLPSVVVDGNLIRQMKEQR
jgi:hypothetical protein